MENTREELMRMAPTKYTPETTHVANPLLMGNKKNDFFSSASKTDRSFFGPNTIQPQLEIGQPNDKYEQEADAVADKVMRMPDPQVQRQPMEEEKEKLQMKRQVPGIQRMCPRCRERARQGKPLDCPECEKELQMKPELRLKGNGKSVAGPAITSQLQSSKGSGSPLPSKTKAELGSKMGADFSGVNVHTDAKAVQMSRQLGARAFTHGSDIYFNRGEYNPHSSSGKHLLAHELTHVVQQGEKSSMVQKAAAASTVTAATVIGWCLSGAAVSVLIDQVIQSGGWVLDRITSGRWNIRQNWCKTIFSALFGCVFGMVGGAAARMIFTEIASFSIAQLARWVHQKLVSAGLSFLAGKWGVMIAKAGCAESDEPADIDPP